MVRSQLSISLEPVNGRPGSQISVVVRNADPYATISVSWESSATGPELANGQADAAGSAQIPVTIPPGAVAGYHQVSVAVGGPSGFRYSYLDCAVIGP